MCFTLCRWFVNILQPQWPPRTPSSIAEGHVATRHSAKLFAVSRLSPILTYSWIWIPRKLHKYLLKHCHNFCCRGRISNPRPILNSSAQTAWGLLCTWFFCKTSKHARLTSHRKKVFFYGFLGPKPPFELKPIFNKSEAYYGHSFSSLNNAKQSKKTCKRTKVSLVRTSTLSSSAHTSAGLP